VVSVVVDNSNAFVIDDFEAFTNTLKCQERFLNDMSRNIGVVSKSDGRERVLDIMFARKVHGESAEQFFVMRNIELGEFA